MQKYFKPLCAVPGLVSGILVYHSPTIGFITLFCFLGAFSLFAFKKNRTINFFELALCIGWSVVGCGAAWYEMRPFYALYQSAQCEKITITGTVTDYAYCEHIRYPHRLTIALLAIEKTEEKACVDCMVYIYTNHRGVAQPYPLGTIVQLNDVKLRKPDDEFARYLIKEGLIGSFFVEWHTIQASNLAPILSLQHWLTQKRATLFQDITAKLSKPHGALFGALFLGNKVHNKKEVDAIQTQFRFWGVAHIFARSGMHISMIIGILLYILFLIPVPYSVKIVLSTIIGIIYALLSWSTISFARSLAMFLWSNYCILARRYTSTLHILGVTTILVLLWHPLNLFFLDFQLSFALTGGLIWICSYLTRCVK